MKNINIIQHNLTEAAVSAHAYTTNINEYKNLIIELAIIPDGIEVRGVLVMLDKEMLPMGYVIHWSSISSGETNPLMGAIDHVKNTLMDTIKKC